MSPKADRRYHRVSHHIWLQAWDDDTRLAAFYLLTCEHRITEGLYRLPSAYAASDLGWSLRRWEKALGHLIADGMVEYDKDAGCVLIVDALAYQSPENPNQAKAAVRAVAQLPRTRLLQRLYAQAETHCERLAEALREGLPELFAEGLGEGIGEPPSPAPSPPPALSNVGGAFNESGDSRPPLIGLGGGA